MSVKNLFIATGIVTLFFGIMLTFFQETLARMVLTDPTMSANNQNLATGYGIVLIAIAVGVFAASSSAPSAARRGYVIQITISGLVLAAHDIYSIVSTHVLKSAAWGTVVIVGLLGLWGLMKLMKERSASL
ncbi:MAG: hypothetical protein JSU01_03755 [Bacteroidetes bacterium]|nr:hypothetical protein [Bacteroidota bacterium]